MTDIRLKSERILQEYAEQYYIKRRNEENRMLQEYAEQYYIKRRNEELQTGFFHESLGFMSKLFDTVYNYIFE